MGAIFNLYTCTLELISDLEVLFGNLPLTSVISLTNFLLRFIDWSVDIRLPGYIDGYIRRFWQVMCIFLAAE